MIDWNETTGSGVGNRKRCQVNRGVFLSLGSNVGDRQANLVRALRGLDASGIRPARYSSLYETEPVEVSDQADFINLACEVNTDLEPEALLQRAFAIERGMGRIRTGNKGPRTIDIDILFFRQLVLGSDHLTLPHPRLRERRFVLVPLSEIAPDFRDPLTGKTVATLLAECADLSRVTQLAGPDELIQALSARNPESAAGGKAPAFIL